MAKMIEYVLAKKEDVVEIKTAFENELEKAEEEISNLRRRIEDLEERVFGYHE